MKYALRYHTRLRKILVDSKRKGAGVHYWRSRAELYSEEVWSFSKEQFTHGTGWLAGIIDPNFWGRRKGGLQYSDILQGKAICDKVKAERKALLISKHCICEQGRPIFCVAGFPPLCVCVLEAAGYSVAEFSISTT